MSGWAKVPGWVFDSAVSPSEKLVLVALCRYADADGRCFPSRRRLARDTSLDVRTVARLLDRLESSGVLARERNQRADGSWSANTYTLAGGDGGVVPPYGGVMPLHGGVVPLHGGVVPLHGGVVPHHELTTELTTELTIENCPENSSDGSPLREGPSSTCSTEDREPNPKPSLEGKAHDPLRDLPEAIVKLWNEVMAPQGHPRVLKLTTERRKKLLARIKESSGRQTIEGWRVIFEAVREHPFFGGHRPGRNGPFHAPLDWLVRSEDNIVRLLEDVAAQRETAPDTISWEPVEPEGAARC